ncbi:hypothetical protein PIB30_007249 [Stylosanthes scabra]|uniref:Uncharacterized protein n=1 Tax=Stylosanthes scabra TaxID=79078 RepID=A0ABU6V733_9FABA|nr:hypothetical protein [Stylosanthes scabra]
MAESFIFSIAESLVGKLVSQAFERASRVVGVYNDMLGLKDTLSFVKAVLLDAEQKQEQNHQLREWLKQLKCVFYDAEDLMDEVECEVARRDLIKKHGSTKRKVCRFFSSSNPVAFRCRIAYQIKEIKDKLDKVAADRNKFGLEVIPFERRVVHKREMTHSYVSDLDVIGRDDDKKHILDLLLKKINEVDGKSVSVVSIVGLGGLGKTALAKYVFNDNTIDGVFPLKLWVCVSDEFDLKQIMIKILNSAPTSTNLGKLEDLDVEQLQKHLRDVLADKKFLLVMDDVWNKDRVKWEELRNLLQVGAHGSKVLVTTRNRLIGSMMSNGSFYSLEGLSHQDSMSLFLKWAFRQGVEKNHPQLVEIGEDIVRKCGGLPLALRTLGSSLFLKFDVKEWEFVRDNEIWNLDQKESDVLPALKFSYDQLPSYLKRFFALFSLYPKDYIFNTSFGTLPWEALGLLPLPNAGQTVDDLIRECLWELQSISFLEEFVDRGGFNTFKLHDLVHDLVIYVAKDEFQCVNSRNSHIPESIRHLSFMENELLDKASIPTGVRTIVFPQGGEGANSERFLNTISTYKYLRVLDLSFSKYETLPHAIGKLKHLRFLSLEDNYYLQKLPDSLCELQSLQTLIFDECVDLQTLPKRLGNLINLRQLRITTKQSDFPEKEISKLTSLELLAVSGAPVESLFQGLELANLKALYLRGCLSLKSLQLDAQHIPNLESLSIAWCPELELSNVLDDQNSKLRLKSLTLFNLRKLVTLPQWLQGYSYSLKSLFIMHCSNLEELPEWLTTMTYLNKIVIKNCPELISLPDGMHNLINLERLQIINCPELCKRCKPHEGQYWPLISHIKYVIIDDESIISMEH